MSTTLITLGSSPKLSLTELHHVYPGEYHPLNRYQYTSASIKNPQEAIHQLGGTVKFASPIGRFSQKECIQTIAQLISDEQLKKIAFSVTDSSIDLQDIASSIKKITATFRYRLLKDPRESAGILDKYQEIQLVNQQDGLLIARVNAVQDIDRWSAKDYQRPASNPRSGMLPPKIARIMINLSMDAYTPQNTIYDPFCGSGTILMEGLDRGISVIGSDIDAQAVNDTQQNLEWFKRSFHPPGEHQAFHLDATQLAPSTLSHQVDAVVFEGFLGPPNIKPEEIANYHKGLYKLYKGVFKRLPYVLKPSGMVVCALPYFTQAKHVKTYDNLVDECEKYGYTTVRQPLLYGRKEARVKRRLYFLRYKKN